MVPPKEEGHLLLSAIHFCLSPMLKIHPARAITPSMQPAITRNDCAFPSRLNEPAIISIAAAKTMIDELMAFIVVTENY